MDSSDESLDDLLVSDILEQSLHLKAYQLPPNVVFKYTMYWEDNEEDELINGILFMLKRYRVNNVSTYHKLIEKVSTYLTFTLHDKANSVVILRKMRFMTDLYRHYKNFLFLRDGVSYNAVRRITKCGPKYWRTVEQESEREAYFRTYGFRHYESRCRILGCYNLEQFASYIDEAVYRTIPVGIGITGGDVYYHLKCVQHRARYRKLKKSDMVTCYNDNRWTNKDWDVYFFHGGWEPYDSMIFIDKLVELVDKWVLETNLNFLLLVSTISCRYNNPDNDQLTYDGILDKIRSLAYVHQLFKRFVFNIVGVDYNFLRHEARVNNEYLNREGKEPLYMWMFRKERFLYYEPCYHVFEEKGLGRYVYDHLAHIDPVIPNGVKISSEEDVFKCYYQED